jgi:hypothetical protein
MVGRMGALDFVGETHEATRLQQEREAWADLVKAERRFHDQTDLLGERDEDAKGARAGVDDAVEALRELGVDVDRLLAGS